MLGYQQGHYEVVTRLDGVVLAVPQLETEVSLLSPTGQTIEVPTSRQLDTFKAEIRALRNQGLTK